MNAQSVNKIESLAMVGLIGKAAMTGKMYVDPQR
jgi:hypothetical protein